MNIKCIICDNATQDIFTRGKYHFLKCEECTFIFVDPHQLKKDYYKQYENSLLSLKYYQATQSYDHRSFVERLAMIDKLVSKAGNLLEIGSNIGTFLKAAQEKGWKTVGIEPNKAVQQYTRQNLPNTLIYNKFFNSRTARNITEKYDLIYSSDVIEHVDDPVAFITAAKNLLKRNGLLVMVTPDFDSILTRAFQIKPKEHLTYFNKRSITKLSNITGLEIVSLQNTHRYRNIKAMLHSTTLKQSNHTLLFRMVQIINLLNIQSLVERVLDLFKEDIFIVLKPRPNQS